MNKNYWQYLGCGYNEYESPNLTVLVIVLFLMLGLL